MAEPNPMRRRVLIILGVCLGLLVYHLVADRFTPYTNQAYVQAFVVDIAPELEQLLPRRAAIPAR